MSAICGRCNGPTGPSGKVGGRGAAKYCVPCEKRAMVDVLVSYIQEHGYAPSAREVQRLMDMSAAGTQRILAGLRADGVIDWKDGHARTIHFVKP